VVLVFVYFCHYQPSTVAAIYTLSLHDALPILDEVYDFIDFRNQTHSTFEKLYRIDRRDYPETAVREALLNLLVHREYSFRASSRSEEHTSELQSRFYLVCRLLLE